MKSTYRSLVWTIAVIITVIGFGLVISGCILGSYSLFKAGFATIVLSGLIALPAM